MTRRAPPHSAPAARQAGFTLIVGLVFLLVMALLSLAMFRSFGLQEKIAGNTMDKQRAFEAAQSTLKYGEWWLYQQSSAPPPTPNCAGAVDGNTLANMRVCMNALAAPDSLPWATRIDYQPKYMTVAAGGGTVAGGDINYNSKPSLYIQYLGTTADGKGLVYQLTAAGYGGNANTLSVLQSTYELTSTTKDLGGL